MNASSICKKCGIELSAGNKFCTACGTSGQDDAGAAAPVDNAQCRSVGIRFVALLIDGIPLGVVCYLVGFILAGIFGGRTGGSYHLTGGPAFLAMFVMSIIVVGYFTVLESACNGQTLGKKITGIRVVSEEGASISMGTAFVRNILRVVDGMFCYLVGAICVWTSPRKQRLGDRAAHTVVISKGR